MKKPEKNFDVANLQPDELNELRKLVQDFVNRLETIENEIKLLNEDRKALFDEFSEKLDMKTLRQALRAVNLRRSIANRDTFDAFVEVIDGVE